MKPLNPVGTCFFSVCNSVVLINNVPDDTIICHAICHAIPKTIDDKPIAHAWIEANHKDGYSIAIDTTYNEVYYKDSYRNDLRIERLVTYTKEEFIANYNKYKSCGPWDAEINKVALETGYIDKNGNPIYTEILQF